MGGGKKINGFLGGDIPAAAQAINLPSVFSTHSLAFGDVMYIWVMVSIAWTGESTCMCIIERFRMDKNSRHII